MPSRTNPETGSVLAYVFVICLSVLLLGIGFLQSNGSVTRSIRDSYHQQLADEAAESGLAYAKYCLLKNNTPATTNPWSSAALQADTNCGGTIISGAPKPHLIDRTGLRTSFTVDEIHTVERTSSGYEDLGDNVQQIVATGYTELLDESDAVVKTYTSIKRHTVPRQTYQTTVVEQGIDYACSIVRHRDRSPNVDDRRIRCVGRNTYGQLGDNNPGTNVIQAHDDMSPDTHDVLRETGVMEDMRVIDLTAGGFHACAIAADSSNNNRVYCWGRNDEGQLGMPPAASLGLCSGSRCSPKPVEITNNGALNGNRIVSIKASYKNTYALDEQGRLYAWGNNTFSQVGNGTATAVTTPTMIATNGFHNTSGSTISNFYDTYALDKIATGPRAANACVLARDLASDFDKSDGIALCWGTSQESFGGTPYRTGANGDGTLLTRNRPKQITAVGGTAIRDIVMDGYFKEDGGIAIETHACLLTETGVVQCWGNNSAKQVNSSSTSHYTSPQVISAGDLGTNDNVSDIVAIGRATCALKAGKVYCWGTDVNGTQNTPTELTIPSGNPIEDLPVTGLTGGSDQTCAQVLYQSYCWGDNNYGQLGDRSTSDRSAPVKSPAFYENYFEPGNYRHGRPIAPQWLF
jgi:alpha-tubulin suppressor-like RCC1 family protein